MSNPFAKLEITSFFEYHMLDADGELMYMVDKDGNQDETKPTIFKVYSTDSKKFIADRNALLDKMKHKRDKKMSMKDQELIQNKTLMSIIHSWENLPDCDGGDIKFSEEMKAFFVEKTGLAYMHRQLSHEAAKTANFKNG